VSPVRRVLLAIVVVAVAWTAISLGRWQLRRLDERRARNALLIASGARPPMVLPAELPANGSVDSGRRIVARGHFDASDQIILRGHVQEDGPGVQIVTPFVFDSSNTVLWVLRGFARSPDAVTPPDPIPAPEPGTVTISGLALAIPVTTDSGAPLLHNGVTTWKRLDRGVTARHRPGSLSVYLLLEKDATDVGHLAIVAPVALNDGPHLSYALQWFGIALAVLTFGVIAFWRDGRASPPRLEAP
jgi:surfeit locus 1 family protein